MRKIGAMGRAYSKLFRQSCHRDRLLVRCAQWNAVRELNRRIDLSFELSDQLNGGPDRELNWMRNYERLKDRKQYLTEYSSRWTLSRFQRDELREITQALDAGAERYAAGCRAIAALI